MLLLLLFLLLLIVLVVVGVVLMGTWGGDGRSGTGTAAATMTSRLPAVMRRCCGCYRHRCFCALVENLVLVIRIVVIGIRASTACAEMSTLVLVAGLKVAVVKVVMAVKVIKEIIGVGIGTRVGVGIVDLCTRGSVSTAASIGG